MECLHCACPILFSSFFSHKLQQCCNACSNQDAVVCATATESAFDPLRCDVSMDRSLRGYDCAHASHIHPACSSICSPSLSVITEHLIPTASSQERWRKNHNRSHFGRFVCEGRICRCKQDGTKDCSDVRKSSLLGGWIDRSRSSERYSSHRQVLQQTDSVCRARMVAVILQSSTGAWRAKRERNRTGRKKVEAGEGVCEWWIQTFPTLARLFKMRAAG